MPSLADILKDPNYINANTETKAAIFYKHSAADPNYTNSITFVCRAVSLKRTVDESANNKDIAYAVRDEIANSVMVNPDLKATQLVGEISPDDANGTFTITVNVTPAKPLIF